MKKILAFLAAAVLAAPAFGASFNGKGVDWLDGSLKLDETKLFVCSDLGGEVGCFFGGHDPAGKWIGPSSVKDRKLEVDDAAGRAVLTGTLAQTEKSPETPFRASIELQPDKRTARVEIKLSGAPETLKGFRLGLNFVFHGRVLGEKFEREILIDGEKADFERKLAEDKRFVIVNKPVKSLVVDSVADREILKFSCVKGGALKVAQNYDRSKQAFDRFDCFFAMSGAGELALDLDFDTPQERKSSASCIIGEMNFAPAQFQLPDYSLCKNLLPNASFEEGLYFWQFGDRGELPFAQLKGERPLQIDETDAVEGKRSLRLFVYPDYHGNAGTFAMPSFSHKKYAVSFWAKTDMDDAPEIYLTGWSQGYGLWQNSGSFGKLSKEWKRYSRSIEIPNRLMQIALAPVNVKSCGHVWFDAVQVELGDKATDFVKLPVGAVLETDDEMNLFEPGAKMNPRVRVESEKALSGKLEWSVGDLFKRELKSGAAEFATEGGSKPALVSLPEFAGLPSGTYAFKAKIVAGSFKNEIVCRFTVMPFMNKEFKHRFLFNGAYRGRIESTTEKDMRLFSKAGCGSLVEFDPPTKELYERYLKPLNIEPCSQIFSPEAAKSNSQESFLDKYNIARPKANGLQTVKDEDLPLFEKQAFEVASKYPYVKFWKTVNEPMYSKEDAVLAAKVLAWTHKGIRRANPDAKILTPDSGAIGDASPKTFWEACEKGSCDYPSAHPYREHPEDPDLDKDLAEFISYFAPGQKVCLSEGNLFTMFELPENNTVAIGDGKALASADGYRSGHFTYDIGIGEKAALAHRLRYRLQVLKHADRIVMDNDWGFTFPFPCSLGADEIPDGLIFSINTLAVLLGDADYKADVVFGDPVRCYLFEDKEKRPVAALWNFHKRVFLDPSLISSLDMAGMKEKFELFNMCGAPEALPESKRLPVTGAPLFLRGAPGRLEAFKKNLESLDMLGGVAPDFRVDSKIEDGKLKLALVNVRAKENGGKLTISADGKELLSESVRLKPQGEFKFETPAPSSPERKRVVYALNLQPEGKAPLTKTFDLDCFEAAKAPEGFEPDGSLEKWKDAASIPLTRFNDLPVPSKLQDRFANPVFRKGDQDFSASFRAKWSEKALFLLIEVKDDVYAPDQDENPLKSYNGDGVQLYIDAFGDARNSGESGYGPDDQSFQIRCRDGKTVEVAREQVPWKQYSFTEKGLDKRIKGTFLKTDDGYRFDLAFPLETIPPALLERGRALGVSLLVNDNDGDYRKRSVQLNPGEQPLNNPQTYPLLLLK